MIQILLTSSTIRLQKSLYLVILHATEYICHVDDLTTVDIAITM